MGTARFVTPTDVAVRPGTEEVFVSDDDASSANVQNSVRVVDLASGTVSTRAVGGLLVTPFRIEAHADGTAYVADGSRVLRIGVDGSQSVLATGVTGSGPLALDPSGSALWFTRPYGAPNFSRLYRFDLATGVETDFGFPPQATCSWAASRDVVDLAFGPDAKLYAIYEGMYCEGGHYYRESLLRVDGPSKWVRMTKIFDFRRFDITPNGGVLAIRNNGIEMFDLLELRPDRHYFAACSEGAPGLRSVAGCVKGFANGFPGRMSPVFGRNSVAVAGDGVAFVSDGGNSRVRAVGIPKVLRVFGLSFAAWVSTGLAEDPVNTATGNLTETSADLVFSELFGMDWGRTYNSMDTRGGVLGLGWSTPLDVSISASSQVDNRHVRLPDGREVRFERDGTSGWAPPEDFDGELRTDTDSSLSVAMRDGSVWDFDTQGRLMQLRNWDGQTVTLARTGTAVTSMTSSTGTSLAFTYDAGRLTTVSASDGRTVTYSYETAGVVTLRTVTGPDGIVSGTYTTDATGRVVSIADASGAHVLSGVVYDSAGRLLSQTVPVDGISTFAYDLITGTTTVTHVSTGDVVVYDHDSDGRLVQVRDRYGATAARQWDGRGRPVSSTARGGAGVDLSYDGDGRLTSMTGPDGISTTYTWDSSDRLLSVSRPASGQGTATTAFCYDLSAYPSNCATANGQREPLRVVGPVGDITDYTYANGLVTSVTDPDGVTVGYTYTPGRRVATITTAGATTGPDDNDVTVIDYCQGPGGSLTVRERSPLGTATPDDPDPCATVEIDDYVTETSYDPAGRLVRSRSADGAISTYIYDLAGRLARSEDPAGGYVDYDYDPATGRKVSETRPAPTGSGATTVVTAHSVEYRLVDGIMREVETTTGPGGAKVEHVYGDYRRLLSRRELLDDKGTPDSADDQWRQTTHSYDSDGRLTATTDIDGAINATGYDPAGRPTTTTDPLSRTTTTTYDVAGRTASVTDPAGSTTTYSYDQADRLTSTTDAEGAVTTNTWSAAGRLTAKTDPLGQATTYGYDAAGRQVNVTTPLGHTTTTAYDPNGRAAQHQSPSGLITSIAFDPLGQPTAVTDPNDEIWSQTWTSRGALAASADPTGATVTYQYDPAGLLVAVSDANDNVTTFGYDAAGRRTQMIDAAGETWGRTYDIGGRLRAETDPLSRTTTHSYDHADRRISTQDPSGRTETLTYDLAGQLTSLGYSDGTTVSYNYDEAGRRTSMTDPTGTTTWAYDNIGNLLEATAGDGDALTYTWDPAGRRSSLTYPAGAVLAYGYDNDGRLISTNLSTGGSSSYQWDDDARLVREDLPGDLIREWGYTGTYRTRYLQQRAGVTIHDTALDYDSAGRLIHDHTNLTTKGYTYDPAGQLASETAGTLATTWVYDARGHRTAEVKPSGSTSWAYDDAGQLTTQTSPTGTTTFTYDEAGRLAVSEGQLLTEYTYDGRGLPMEISTSESGTDTGRITRTYDGNRQLLNIADTSGTTTTDTDLLWDNQRAVPEVAHASLDGSESTDFVYGVGRDYARTATTSFAFNEDHQASMIADPLQPSSARWMRSTSYDPWGNPEGDGPTGLAFGYRGELHLGDQLHLRNRDYFPTMAAFATPDPLDGVPGQTTIANLYHYSSNDPLNQTDPLGLRPHDEDLSISDFDDWCKFPEVAAAGGYGLFYSDGQECVFQGPEDSILRGFTNPGLPFVMLPGSLSVRIPGAIGLAALVAGSATMLLPDLGPDPTYATSDSPSPGTTTTVPRDPRRPRLRIQVQPNSNHGEQFSTLVYASNQEVGATVAETIPRLEELFSQLTPRRFKEAAGPTFAIAENWIRARPPAGVSGGGNLFRREFTYRGTIWRLDIENLVGDNLRL